MHIALSAHNFIEKSECYQPYEQEDAERDDINQASDHELDQHAEFVTDFHIKVQFCSDLDCDAQVAEYLSCPHASRLSLMMHVRKCAFLVLKS